MGQSQDLECEPYIVQLPGDRGQSAERSRLSVSGMAKEFIPHGENAGHFNNHADCCWIKEAI